MESIELTLEHKSKIMEMCSVLFPEYGEPHGHLTFHHHDDGKPDHNNPPNYLPGFLFGFKSNGEDGDLYDTASTFIHWFEFCTVYLLKRIWERMEKYHENHIYRGLAIFKRHTVSLQSDLLIGCFSASHPVDYIYEKFKTLNA